VICRNTNLKRSPIHIRTHQDFLRYLPQAAAYDQAEIAELSKLEAPASMASDWQEILAANQIIAENTIKVAQFVKVNNTYAAHAMVVAATQAQDQMISTAQRDGFKDCARAS
jgi:hypothetical protein